VARDVDALDAGEGTVEAPARDADAGVRRLAKELGRVTAGVQGDVQGRAIQKGIDGRRQTALETFQERAEAAPGAPGSLPDRPPPAATLLPLVPLQPAPQQ